MNLFLFPHQDDEYFISPEILINPNNSLCIFLTKGDYYGSNTEIRNSESKKVLLSLGVSPENIIFLMDSLPIPDNNLINYLEEVYQGILKLIANKSIESIYTTAYEGGHPDHDAATGIAFVLSLTANCPAYQFFLYNAFNVTKPFFQVMKPLQDNKLEKLKIKFKDSVRVAFLFLNYKSQFKTWLGLGLFAIYHFFIQRHYYKQSISAHLFYNRPHTGELYYEMRNWMSYDSFKKVFESFFLLHGINIK
ncbi:MAG: PIG-L family deacetylase [Leptospira sp.]|nr:PIG-L family deacetylase [Leptospira sp.]